MSSNAQLWIALVVVAAAAAFLLHRTWRFFFGTKSPGCGSCTSGGCGSKGPGELPIVSLEELRH